MMIRRGSVAALLMAVLMVVNAGTAYANKLSDPKYYTVNGKHYVNMALAASVYPGQAWASADVGPTSGSSIPSGWQGALGRMYTASTGTIYCSGTLVFNPATVYSGSFTVSQTCTRYAYGYTFYAKGETQAWNGNGYTTYSTLRTVNETS